MVIKVGINGFGRIGRVIFRTCCQVPELKVSAINDPAIDLEYIAYLIKFDSTHGKFKEHVSYEHNEIKINGHPVKVFHQKSPPDIPWQDAGVQYVVEASGMFTTLEKASGHLASSCVKRVLVTAPSSDVPMLILGVNQDRFSPEIRVISCASSTLYCLAPLVKLLQDAFGVSEGLVTSIHAMTPSLKPLDGLCVRGKQWRDHRSIHQNIIPAATGACRALARVLPAVRDKLTGLAFRVPIADVSVLDLSIRLDKSTSVKEITESIEKMKNSPLRNIMQVSREQAVSSDFIGDSHSCTLDVDSSLQLTPNFFKLICWYENEYSYACRVVDTILYCEGQQAAIVVPSPTKIMFTRPGSCRARSEHQQTDAIKRHVGIECISFPLLSASPYESCLAKRFMRPIVKSPAKFVMSETKQPRVLSQESDKLRTTGFHQSTIASQHTSSKERSQDYVSLKAPEILLQQSTSKKLEPKFANKTSYDMTGKLISSARTSFQTESKENRGETTATNNKDQQYSIVSDISGDVKSYSSDKSKFNRIGDTNTTVIKNDINEKVRNLHEVTSQNEPNVLNNIQRACRKPITPINTKENEIESSKTDRRILENQVKQHNMNEGSETQVTKKCNSFMEDFNKNAEYGINLRPDNVASQSAVDVIHIISENTDSEEALLKNDKQDTNNLNDPKQLNNCHTQNNIKREDGKTEVNEIESLLENAASKIKIVDEKLKQHNIVLIENAHVIIASESSITAGDYQSREYEGTCNESRSCNDPTVLLSEQSGCASPCHTVTVSNLERRSQRDLYDKLDSASVSDSNNSFRVLDKESQIIDFTDLNHSLEDLNRLDKICRIIEISDELSDKLFAPLAAPLDAPAPGRQRWSFGDLCERIKLDDFCHDVFGETSQNRKCV